MWYLTGIYRQVLPVGVDIWISRAAQAVRAGGCEAKPWGTAGIVQPPGQGALLHRGQQEL